MSTTKLVLTILLGALALGCTNESKLDGSGGSLEARVKKLEEANAKYAEALDFLQKVYQQQKQQQAQQERDEPAPDAVFAVDIAPNLKAGLVEGPASGAPVTIVKAWDFACPYCERVSVALEELVKEYDGKLRVVFKNLVVHPQVMNAHLAGCAAGKQQKFQKFKAVFWEKGFKARKMDDANIEAIAKEIGLDMAKFKADKDGEDCKQLIQNDMAELQKFKVNSTPTFFVNGTHVGGALPKENFKQLVDEKLKTAEGQKDYYDKVIMATGDKQFRSKMDKH